MFLIWCPTDLETGNAINHCYLCIKYSPNVTHPGRRCNHGIPDCHSSDPGIGHLLPETHNKQLTATATVTKTLQSNAPSQSAEHNPTLTLPFKRCGYVLAPVTAYIIHMSLETGCA